MSKKLKTNITELTEISEEIDGWFYRFWYVRYGKIPGTVVYRSRDPSFDSLDEEILGIDGIFHNFLECEEEQDQVFVDNESAKKHLQFIL